jgi:magnesium chelatase family protein
LRNLCGLTATSTRRAIELAELEGLSGRGTERLLRVARTIADLAGRGIVVADDLEEAARYRSPVATLAIREAS